MSENVGLFLHQWASSDPDRVGIVDSGHDDLTLSYAWLDLQARSMAAHLSTLDLGPDDRVAICMENGLDFVRAWFGALYAGCATLPIPTSSTDREIAFRLSHADCRALITDSSRMNVARAALGRAGGDRELVDVAESDDADPSTAVPYAVPHDAPALLLYTSGTTGAAKCACITHGSLRDHTRALAIDTLGLTEQDRVLGTLPLSHSYGIRGTLLVPFCAGARTIFTPKFSPRRTLALCVEHEVTWLPGVPTMFIAWANETDAPQPKSLRWCMSAGAPLVEDVRRRAEKRLGAPVRQAYGLTEASLTTINAPPDEAVPGSSGKPVAGTELRIADENGGEVPQGTHGEVLVRGSNLMAGYLDDRTATAHVMRGGWLHTGDIGCVDEAGRLTIVDRSKDLILRGGASIYPSEIEDVLSHHEAVREAAVVGKPDDYYGEIVVAVVVLAGEVTAEQLDAWVRERLSATKAPVSYAFVTELPRGGSGKTLKRELREQLVRGDLPARPLRTDGPTQ